MLDILLLRKDLDTAIARLETRKKPQAFLDVSAFQALESERKTLQTRTEELQAQRNQLSKQVGMLMSRGDKDGAEAIKAQVAAGKVELEQSAARLEQIQAELLAMLCRAEPVTDFSQQEAPLQGYAGTARLADGTLLAYRIERTSQVGKVPRRAVNLLLDRTHGLLRGALSFERR